MIITNQEVPVEDIGDKKTRKVLVAGEEMMLVEFQFPKGGIGVPHQHEEHDKLDMLRKEALR